MPDDHSDRYPKRQPRQEIPSTIVIDLGAGSKANACHTVEEVAVRIDGTTKIETTFGTSISAGLQRFR